MPIEINGLECKRFGIVAARLTDLEAPLDAVDAAASQAGVDMLTARIDVADLRYVHALEAGGFRLMDTLLHYARKLEDLPPSPRLRQGVTVRPAQPEDAARSSDIAREGFKGYFGHYHADPRLDNAAADAAYVEWAEVSTAMITDDTPVLLVEHDHRVVGFLTLRRNHSNTFEIVLNAVHPDSQGKGLYAALVIDALRLAREAGAEKMITSTQINNYAVQRVWARLGFIHYRSVYTFHKWYDR